METDRNRADDEHQLRRALGLTALTFYGVGDILGAGIYALVGRVAGLAGSLSWLSFLIALVVAAFTGLAYAELGGRFPRSGGEALFCEQAFRRPWVATLIGWLVFCSGVVSLATVSRAFAGYFQVFVPGASLEIVAIGLLLLLAGINAWGIGQSSTANIACTVVEASGLLLLICVGLAFLISGNSSNPVEPVVATRPAAALTWFAVAQGGALAFFAFIGFEDMVNVSEEVENPARNMPLAILLATSIAGVLYIVVVAVATAVVPAARLAESNAPLLEVVRTAAPIIPPWLFTGIALSAVANTGLLNFIMASRLIYGMSRQGLLPPVLGAVHAKRRTPHRAILVVLLVAIALATTGTLVYLAGTTSALILLVFCAVNVALVRLKLTGGSDGASFAVPIVVPILGAVTTLLLFAFVSTEALVSTGVLIGLGTVLISLRGRIPSRP